MDYANRNIEIFQLNELSVQKHDVIIKIEFASTAIQKLYVNGLPLLKDAKFELLKPSVRRVLLFLKALTLLRLWCCCFII